MKVACFINKQQLAAVDKQKDTRNYISFRIVRPRIYRVMEQLFYLCDSIRNNDTKFLKEYMKRGLLDVNNALFNANTRDFPGYTPLHYAMEFERLETMKLLLSYGASISVKNGRGENALHMATQLGDQKMFDLIFAVHSACNDNTNPMDNKGFTYFLGACTRKEPSFVKAFLQNQDDINATVCSSSTKYNSYTGLHLAVAHGCTETAELLLRHGANVNAKNCSDSTPLHLAVEENSQELVNLLLRHGADINIEDRSSKTPLLYSMHVNNDRIYYALQDHVKKLRIINFVISEKNESCYFWKWKLMDPDDKFYLQCTAELNRMKDLKVDQYSSLYNIIFRNPNEMALHVRNDSFKQILTSSDFDTTFSLYGYLIKLQFKNGLARQVLIKPAKDSLEYLTGLSMPDACSETIFKYLTNEHMKDLIEAKL